MEIAVAILITLLTVVTTLWMNERIQRNNVEERNKKLRKNLRRSNDFKYTYSQEKQIV